MCFSMRLLTILLFGFSLTAQVNPTAPASLFTAGVALPAAPNPAMERLLPTVELHPTARPGRRLYLWSLAMLAASGAADVASSWRRPEANPVIGWSRIDIWGRIRSDQAGAGRIVHSVGAPGASTPPGPLSPRRLAEFRHCRGTGSGGAA